MWSADSGLWVGEDGTATRERWLIPTASKVIWKQVFTLIFLLDSNMHMPRKFYTIELFCKDYSHRGRLAQSWIVLICDICPAPTLTNSTCPEVLA
jgi:hypothetical protein